MGKQEVNQSMLKLDDLPVDDVGVDGDGRIALVFLHRYRFENDHAIPDERTFVRDQYAIRISREAAGDIYELLGSILRNETDASTERVGANG